MASRKFDDNFCVIVLGDIGRSPRVTNHIVELSENTQSSIDVFCYENTSLPPSLLKQKINIYRLSYTLLGIAKYLPSLFYVILRFIIESLQIFYFLFFKSKKRYGYILVQNPPSFHIMMILHIYKVIKNCSIIIDMHNYGYTLYQTNNQLIKRILKFLEIFWLKLTGNSYLVVSKAMSQELETTWGLTNVVVLYDKPNKTLFKPITLMEKHYFLEQFVEFKTDRQETFFTRLQGDDVVEKENRPLLLLSSSSFTIDDDYETLLNALKQYEERNNAKKIVLVMSGHGPEKEYWQKKFEQTHFDHINVLFKWFEPAKYPLMVACADYGICMHKSTSGVDLPIKILDLQSCKIPVIAYAYSPTIKELVIENKNGYLFNTSSELADILVRITSKNKRNFEWTFDDRDWKTEWKRNFYKVL